MYHFCYAMEDKPRSILCKHMKIKSAEINWVFEQEFVKVPLSLWGHFKKPEPYEFRESRDAMNTNLVCESPGIQLVCIIICNSLFVCFCVCPGFLLEVVDLMELKLCGWVEFRPT